jgi:hypothetical protein
MTAFKVGKINISFQTFMSGESQFLFENIPGRITIHTHILLFMFPFKSSISLKLLKIICIFSVLLKFQFSINLCTSLKFFSAIF